MVTMMYLQSLYNSYKVYDLILKLVTRSRLIVMFLLQSTEQLLRYNLTLIYYLSKLNLRSVTYSTWLHLLKSSLVLGLY